MITPEMSIAEVMRMDPEVAPVFMSYGMHCLYCPHASAESIAEASLVHGIDANALVASLNEYFAGKESKYFFQESSTRRVLITRRVFFYPFPSHKSARRT